VPRVSCASCASTTLAITRLRKHGRRTLNSAQWHARSRRMPKIPYAATTGTISHASPGHQIAHLDRYCVRVEAMEQVESGRARKPAAGLDVLETAPSLPVSHIIRTTGPLQALATVPNVKIAVSRRSKRLVRKERFELSRSCERQPLQLLKLAGTRRRMSPVLTDVARKWSQACARDDRIRTSSHMRKTRRRRPA
jgi:hypothetical protein